MGPADEIATEETHAKLGVEFVDEKGDTRNLTDEELLNFINTRMKRDGVPPSFDEMKEALDLRSKSGIHRLITALEERGFIRRLAHRARAIEIVKLPEPLAETPAGFEPRVIQGDRVVVPPVSRGRRGTG